MKCDNWLVAVVGPHDFALGFLHSVDQRCLGEAVRRDVKVANASPEVLDLGCRDRLADAGRPTDDNVEVWVELPAPGRDPGLTL